MIMQKGVERSYVHLNVIHCCHIHDSQLMLRKDLAMDSCMCNYQSIIIVMIEQLALLQYVMLQAYLGFGTV